MERGGEIFGAEAAGLSRHRDFREEIQTGRHGTETERTIRSHWRHQWVQGTEKWARLASFGTRDAVLMLALA